MQFCNMRKGDATNDQRVKSLLLLVWFCMHWSADPLGKFDWAAWALKTPAHQRDSRCRRVKKLQENPCIVKCSNPLNHHTYHGYEACSSFHHRKLCTHSHCEVWETGDCLSQVHVIAKNTGTWNPWSPLLLLRTHQSVFVSQDSSQPVDLSLIRSKSNHNGLDLWGGSDILTPHAAQSSSPAGSALPCMPAKPVATAISSFCCCVTVLRASYQIALRGQAHACNRPRSLANPSTLLTETFWDTLKCKWLMTSGLPAGWQNWVSCIHQLEHKHLPESRSHWTLLIIAYCRMLL